MLYMFDIDRTLIRSFLREGGDRSIFDLVEVLPGRREKLAALADEGARFALVTNQGGVAFGYQTTRQVFDKLGVIVAAFNAFYLRPVSVHYCFTHPKATVEAYKVDSARRKPGPAMLLEALEAHDVNGLASVFVGDMDTDQQAAEAAGVRYVDAAEFFA
jgi:D-glycero-D-manno-heptose 1,7-bisphosphate phosphatase